MKCRESYNTGLVDAQRIVSAVHLIFNEGDVELPVVMISHWLMQAPMELDVNAHIQKLEQLCAEFKGKG